MKKLFLSIVLLGLLVFSLSSCKSAKSTKEEKEPSTSLSFVIEFRKQVNKQEITGEIVKSYTIYYENDDVYVIDAFKVEDEKYFLSDTDYFTVYGTGTAIGFNKGYITGYSDNIEFDLSWSYTAYNGDYSQGIALDKLESLNTYTVVIDGWK